MKKGWAVVQTAQGNDTYAPKTLASEVYIDDSHSKTVKQALDEAGATGILPISKGGTGGASEYAARQNLICKSGLTNTKTDWDLEGVTVQFCHPGATIDGAPSAYGLLLNVSRAGEVHQIWMSKPNGALFHRGGNHAGWAGTWTKIIDETADELLNLGTRKKPIPAYADLNNYQSPGSYYAAPDSNASTIANRPCNESFHLVVDYPITYSNYVFQTVYTITNRIFTRTAMAGIGWGSWKER